MCCSPAFSCSVVHSLFIAEVLIRPSSRSVPGYPQTSQVWSPCLAVWMRWRMASFTWFTFGSHRYKYATRQVSPKPKQHRICEYDNNSVTPQISLTLGRPEYVLR
jgi:hypothetical protein